MKNYPLYEVRPLTDVRDMLNQSVRLYGSKNAFLVKKEKGAPYTGITYEQLGRDVQALGTAFSSLGLDGKKIAVIGESCYAWAISYLAALTGASTVVPLDRELPGEDIEILLKTAEVSCIVYSPKLHGMIKKAAEALPERPVMVCMTGEGVSEGGYSIGDLLEKGEAMVKAGDDSYGNNKIDPEFPQILLFTSGTTSFPKGVMLSHRNLAENLMAMCQMLYIDEKDIFLSVLPLHHTYECTCGFLCALYRGCTVAYCEGLKYILPNLKESHATMMLGVPALFEAMYKRIWAMAKKSGQDQKMRTGLKLSKVLGALHIDVRRKLFAQIHETLGGNVRLFISGAAAIDPVVSQGFRDFGIAFLQGYGITECAPIVALNRDRMYRDSAAGLPLSCLTVKIHEPDEEGVGEIICKGGNVMQGYYQNPEATAEVLRDGWFYTGDLGYLDTDGFVHITGRKKNVIVTKNGKNIFPEELETLLNRDPHVLECMIVGEENPEDGETYLCARVVPNYEYIREAWGEQTEEQIKKLIKQAVKGVNDRNPLYKNIRRIEVQNREFEKTTTKKIKRYKELEKKK